MTGVLLALVVLLMFGGDGAASPPPLNKAPDDDDDDGGAVDDGGDTKCPPGAPLIYTGGMLNDSEVSFLNEATENIITPTERATMLYVIGKADSDEGYPAPAAGTCLLEDLQVYLKLPASWPNLGLRGWPAALAMLAFSRANLPLSEPRKWDTLTAIELNKVQAMARYIRAREDDGELDNESLDPPAPVPTRKRTYIVKGGDTLLGMAGAASGYKAGTVGRREYAKEVTLDPVNAKYRIPAKPGSFDYKYLGGYTLNLHGGDVLHFP